MAGIGWAFVAAVVFGASRCRVVGYGHHWHDMMAGHDGKRGGRKEMNDRDAEDYSRDGFRENWSTRLDSIRVLAWSAAFVVSYLFGIASLRSSSIRPKITGQLHSSHCAIDVHVIHALIALA